MLEAIQHFIATFVGPDNAPLSFYYMAIRALIVYAVAVTLVRIMRRRFLARPSSFDFVLALMLGSVVSRAITGNAPFLPTIGAGFVLIGLHTVFSFITFYSPRLGGLIKGHPVILIKDGEFQWQAMKKSHLTKRDLLTAIRRNAQLLSPRQVKLAILERNGEISIIPKGKECQPCEVEIQNGVQTVKIEVK